MTTDIYYEWLLGFIDGNGGTDVYSELLNHLYYRTYVWMLPQDANRADDGIELRARFESEAGIGLKNTSGCSVLEMLIALADRCENEIMRDPVNDDNTWYWFWLMIDNLGLSEYTDDNFYVEEVDQKIDVWMTNQYSRDGAGGLFCVKNFPQDLTHVEIWYQMCWFLTENYG